jgi:hydrogenase nickel incorporation protein HypA/HybF
MHELSIALSIIEGVEEELARREGKCVAAVHLKLGPLSGVVKEALLFSYRVAREGTALEGSSLQIEEIPIVLYCAGCQQEQPAVSVQRLCCTVCDTPSADIRSGSELEVFALELIDEHAIPSATCFTTQAD